VATRSRQGMGALFLLLAGIFGGLAFTAFSADATVVVWGIGVAAIVISLWLLSLSLATFRRGR
jgi:hypothetical protein